MESHLFIAKCRNDWSHSDFNLTDSHILLALSGGVDSMVLFDVLNQMKDELNIKVSCAHINHHLREASDLDQNLVEKICLDHKIQLFTLALNPDHKPTGESVEAWGRRKRYTFLQEILRDIDGDWIATAHHGDDQIETMLMHLSQGAGPLGLNGIGKKQGQIIRPFLSFSKKEIYAYAKENHIAFREDETNLDLHHPRNYLRAKVVEPLKTLTPDLVSQFQTSAQLFSKHNETLDFFIQNSISQLDIDCDSDFVILDKKSLGKFPLLAQSMIIRHLAQNNEIMWRKHHWVDLELFLSKDKTGAILNLPNGAQILDNRLQLKIRIKKHIALNAIDISLGEKVDNKSFSVQIKPLETIPVKKHNSNLEFIDAKAIKGKALKIRPWIFGDRFQPLGMMGTQKMSDFLGKRKVDQFEKETQCVMTADDNIIWVCGRQISHKARIKSSTKKAVSLQFNWK